jgi:transcription initiation factor TFIIB
MSTNTVRQQAGLERSQQSDLGRCPECQGQLVTDGDESLCQECGLVVDDQPLDRQRQWFAGDEAEARQTGPPRSPSIHDHGLHTEISQGVDAKGNRLSGDTRRRFARLRRHNSRAKFESTRDRNLAHGLGEVRRITSALGYPSSLRDQACRLFRSAQDANLLVGRSVEGMAAASVYGACRCAGHSVVLSDVTTVARVGADRIRGSYSTLNVELGLPAEIQDPRTYLPRLASEVDVSNGVEQHAEALLEELERDGEVVGRHPAGVAAACLYAAVREREGYGAVTQSEVAEAADVSTPTIRKGYQALEDRDVGAP